jgi:hypothetical protein
MLSMDQSKPAHSKRPPCIYSLDLSVAFLFLPRLYANLTITTPPTAITPPSSPPLIGLDIPPATQPYHLHAARLNPMVSWTSASTPVRHVTPPLGNVHTVLDLTHKVGVPVDIFWKMFVLCRGCNRIMTGDMITAHICDLSIDKNGFCNYPSHCSITKNELIS